MQAEPTRRRVHRPFYYCSLYIALSHCVSLARPEKEECIVVDTRDCNLSKCLQLDDDLTFEKV